MLIMRNRSEYRSRDASPSAEYAEAYAEGGILIEHFPELAENLLNIYDRMACTATGAGGTGNEP